MSYSDPQEVILKNSAGQVAIKIYACIDVLIATDRLSDADRQRLWGAVDEKFPDAHFHLVPCPGMEEKIQVSLLYKVVLSKHWGAPADLSEGGHGIVLKLANCSGMHTDIEAAIAEYRAQAAAVTSARLENLLPALGLEKGLADFVSEHFATYVVGVN